MLRIPLTSCITVADKREMYSAIIAISKYLRIKLLDVFCNIFLIDIVYFRHTLQLKERGGRK